MRTQQRSFCRRGVRHLDCSSSFPSQVEQGDRVDDTLCALLTGRLQVRTYGSVDQLTGANGSGLHQGKATSNGDLNSHRNRFVCHHGTPWQSSSPIARDRRSGKRTSPPTRTLARHKTICDEAKPPLQQLPSTQKLPVERRTKPPSSISDGRPTTMHLRDVQRSALLSGRGVARSATFVFGSVAFFGWLMPMERA